MRIQYLFLYLVIFVCFDASGQDLHTINSLFQKLAIAKEDSNRVYILDKLSYEYAFIDADKGVNYANEALILSEKLGWKKGVALANSDLAINYRMKFDNVIALEYAMKALKIFEEIKRENDVAAVMANIVSIYLAQGNYADALDYSFKALKIYERIDSGKHKSIVLENIGTIYKEQNEYAKAMEYYSAAYKISQKNNDSGSIARNLGNIAIILNATGSYDSAIAYNKTALKINQERGDNHASQLNLANIANVYFSRRDFRNAMKYNKMALKVSEATNHKNCRAINLGNVGETYLELAKDTIVTDPNKSADIVFAITYLKDAIAICKEINYPAPQLEFMEYLKDAYVISGKYKKALETYEEYAYLRDSIYSVQSKNTIAQLESNRELGIKTRDLKIKETQLRISELELSKKRKERIIYVVSIVLIGVVLGGVIKRLYVFKKSNIKLKVENKQTGDKLVHSEYRLRQAQTIAHIGNWELNFETGIAVWSEETCRIYGIAPDNNIQSYEKWASFNHPDDVASILETLSDADRTLIPAGFYHRIIRHDGTIRHVYTEAHFDFDDKGQLIGTYGIVQDVTEIKEKEEALRKSNERFELVNKASREAIIDWDIVNDVMIFGDGFSEIFGYSPAAYHNHLLVDNIHPEDKKKANDILRTVLKNSTDSLLAIEFRFLKANKDIAYVELKTIFIRDKNGRAIRAVGSMTDITRLVQKKSALEEQNIALREIAWIQSHVVRPPLASLIGLIELLKHKEKYDVNEIDLIDKIQTATASLDRIIHDVVKKTEAVEYISQDT